MKLKSIRIINMHNVKDRTYNLNGNLTYFIGPNGAGKSTILEAIQLVILGYIPGYSKTNEAIMKHSSSDILQVIGTFDDNTSVVRSWVRKGASVSSSSVKFPAGITLDPTLGTTFSGTIFTDDTLELPIYNFNEFKDMTANKLKEWFISFLPSQDNGIDWRSRLIEVTKERRPILSDKLLEETLNKISDLNKSYSGVELVQQLNTYLKSEQSFDKKEIERLQSTIQSLIHYDEELPSDERAKADLDKYLQMMKDRASYDNSVMTRNSIKANIARLNIPEDDTIQSIEDVESYIELLNAITNTEVALREVSGAKDKYAFSLDSIKRRITDLSKISSSVCPYTSKECNEIALLRADNLKEIDKLNKELTDLHRLVEEKAKTESELSNKLFMLKTQAQNLERDYSTYFNLRNTLASMSSCTEPPLSKEEIDAKITECQESLAKIEANKKYNELIDVITQDEYQFKNDLEIIKIWTKFTDANGLQTEIMTRPFEHLAADMNTYLSAMFQKPIQAHFNLSAKANSFGFGLVRDNNFIEFDYLSSGERCLFTLALMICLMRKSNPDIATILIDDLVDHLDDINAATVFNAVSNLNDIQFIIAGVKDCNVEGAVPIQPKEV